MAELSSRQLPRWNEFLSAVKRYCKVIAGKGVSTVETTTANGRTYTVVHGDSLWNIAEKLLGKGSRYTEIVKVNGLKSNVLKYEQVLKIPEK